jgi:hypothetical protein
VLTEEEVLEPEEEVERYILRFCLGEEKEGRHVEEGDGQFYDNVR